MKTTWKSVITMRRAVLMAPFALGLAVAGAGVRAEANQSITEPSIPTDAIAVQDVAPDVAALLPPAIAESGKIRVATVATFPPNEFKDPEGNNVGVHIDMGRALGQVMGVEMDFITTTFDALIPGLQADRYDMAMASAAVTKARLEVVDFVSDLKDGTMLMIAESDGTNFKDELDLCGRKLGVAKGSSQVALASEVAENCKSAGKDELSVQTYPSQLESALALSSGRIDTVIGVGEPLSYISHGNPGRFKVVGDGIFASDVEGNMLPKGSELAEALVAAQNKLIENGTYQEILKKWGVTSAAIDQSEINPTPRR